MKLITRDNPPDIPERIAICPICRSTLFIEDIDEWHPATGRVTEMGFHITCSTRPDEPDSHESEFRTWSWFSEHFATPYIDWLPVQKRVFLWFDKNFRLADENEAQKLARWKAATKEK